MHFGECTSKNAPRGVHTGSAQQEGISGNLVVHIGSGYRECTSGMHISGVRIGSESLGMHIWLCIESAPQ